MLYLDLIKNDSVVTEKIEIHLVELWNDDYIC